MDKLKTNDTEKYMYRYLLKYVGTYRVKAEYDEELNDFPRDQDGSIDPSFEDLYIPCSKGVIKHTYIDKDMLVLCFYDKAVTGKNIYNAIKDKYPKLDIHLDDNGVDVLIYFYAKDIKKIATICKPKTSGAKINPFSNKNLPKELYKIPSKDLIELYGYTKDLDRQQTLQFFKSVNSEFIKKIGKKKALKESRLSTREYIHSIGMWDKYVAFISKAIEKYV